MESFCLSPPCLLLQSNFSQSRVSPDQAFPWIPGLAPQCPHREVHDGISEQEHLMEFNWSFVSSGKKDSIPPSVWLLISEGKCIFVPALLFFFFSLWVKWFPKIHSGWCLWRLPSGDLPYADGECMLPLELWMSRASVPGWKVQKCSNATAWGPNEGRISLQPLKLLRCNLSVWNH